MRTPLDCHRHADLLARWKERLGGGALLLCVGWLATNLVLSEEGDLYSSRGPVTSVHRSWEAQCSACHESFTPISSHSWGAPFLGDVKVSTQKCQSCHEGATHHAGQHPELNCASCHREHRGHEASLVRLPDRDCTQCHRDLGKHHDGATQFELKIASFSKAGHPEFRSIKADPGKLKFNHQRHLTAGMALTKEGGTLMTLGKIPEPMRKRYRDLQADKADGAAVQLQCASCHRLDAGDFGPGIPFNVIGQRGAGAYMQPIVYENQCQACHPLTVERNLTIPHRLNPKEIHVLLEDHYTADAARGQLGFLEQKVTRPLPGKMPDLLPATVRATIAKQVQAEKDLYLSNRLCAECHFFEGRSIVEAFAKGTAELRVKPTQVPTVWLQHAKFNHTSHRAVQCAECHAADGSTSHNDVLIPGRDSCVQCHAPTTKMGTPGVRHGCTDCHLYHNGEHAGQGVGAAKRDARKRQDVDGFLRRK